MRRIAILAMGVALIGATGPMRKGTASGVYTGEQAEQGAQVYAIRCAMCHGSRLEGTVETPGLTGKFMANWGGRPVGDLLAYIGRAMPQSAPGSLSPRENARLVAFLLRQNGAPAGSRPLAEVAAELHGVRIDPAPLP